MMACEEAYLLAQAIRALDPQALLVLGPVPSSGQDEIFRHSQTGQQTFVIKAEKVPNAAGVRRVISMLGGPTASYDEFVNSQPANLKGGWIVGGYLSNWISGEVPAALKSGFRVVQDLLPTALSESADVVLPAAAWAEKDGCWENFAGRIQPFLAAVPPPEGVTRDAEFYLSLLGSPGLYNAAVIRKEMGEPFASVTLGGAGVESPAMEFAEL
jgi:NADH-quinone oxidoreductase subunit G